MRGCADIIYEAKHRRVAQILRQLRLLSGEGRTAWKPPTPRHPKAAQAVSPSAASDAKERRRLKAQQRALLAPRRKKLEQEVSACEAEIGTREARKRELVDQLSSGGYGADYSRMRCELIEQEEKLEALSKRWEGAAEALEKLLAELNRE